MKDCAELALPIDGLSSPMATRPAPGVTPHSVADWLAWAEGRRLACTDALLAGHMTQETYDRLAELRGIAERRGLAELAAVDTSGEAQFLIDLPTDDRVVLGFGGWEDAR
jgi:hypothetical protein